MRTIISSSLIAVLMLSFTFNSAEAQLLKRLKKKAQDAAENKVEEKLAAEIERKAAEMVEKSWDSIFGDLEEGSEEGMRSSIFNLSSNVTTEESYLFNTITTMEIETIKEKGKSEPPVIMEMHFNENEQYTGSKFSGEGMNNREGQGEVFIIYDFKNSAMVMLMESEEDKFSFAYDWQQVAEQSELMNSNEENGEEYDLENDDSDPLKGYSKIGSKDIAGYSCEGYRSENEHTITDLWITDEANFGMPNMFRANTNAKHLRGKVPSDYPTGMLMEMESRDLKSGDKTIMRVTDIKKNLNVTYTMSDYPAMSLGNKPKN